MDLALIVFAFAAGAAAFFAPCCVAMLPAYVAYAARSGNARAADVPPQRRAWARGAVWMGAVPLVLGAVPLLLIGLGSLVPSLSNALAGRVFVDASLALLLVGIAGVVGGLVLAGRAKESLRGGAFGLLATLGFFAVFLTVGLPVALLARGLALYVSWLAVVVGAALIALGVLSLSGRSFGVTLPGVRGDVSTPRGFFLFGVGYGLASLSCTFPIFLLVVGSALVSGGFVAAMVAFAAYSLGKGVLLVGTTALTLAGRPASGRALSRASPVVARAAGALMLATGLYIVFYYGRSLPGVTA